MSQRPPSDRTVRRWGWTFDPHAYEGAWRPDPTLGNAPVWEAIRAELYYEGLGADQLRSNAPVWYEPDADVAWVPQPITAPFDPAVVADLWQEQPGQEASLELRWYQPDTEILVPIPFLGNAPSVDQQAALWPEQPPQQDIIVQPVWHAPEHAQAPPILVSILPVEASLLVDLWTDHSQQQARSIWPTEFQPDTEAWVPGTFFGTGPTTPEFAAFEADELQFPTPVVVVLPDDDLPFTAALAAPFDPAPIVPALVDEPILPAPIASPSPEPEWVPIPGLTVASVDQQAALWPEQPQDPAATWALEPATADTLPPQQPAAFDPTIVVPALADDHPIPPPAPWYQPDAEISHLDTHIVGAVSGLAAVAYPPDPLRGVRLTWTDPPETFVDVIGYRSTDPAVFDGPIETWGAPFNIGAIGDQLFNDLPPPPLPPGTYYYRAVCRARLNTPGGTLTGSASPVVSAFVLSAAPFLEEQSGQEQSLWPTWYEPELAVHATPPFAPTTATVPEQPTWIEQPGQERSLEVRWYEPDPEQAPPAFATLPPPYTDAMGAPLWQDGTGQQDRSLEIREYAPEAAFQPGYAPPGQSVGIMGNYSPLVPLHGTGLLFADPSAGTYAVDHSELWVSGRANPSPPYSADQSSPMTFVGNIPIPSAGQVVEDYYGLVSRWTGELAGDSATRTATVAVDIKGVRGAVRLGLTNSAMQLMTAYALADHEDLQQQGRPLAAWSTEGAVLQNLTAEARPVLAPPGAPTGFGIGSTGPYDYRIQWTDPPDPPGAPVTSIEIWRARTLAGGAKDNADWQLVGTASPATGVYIDKIVVNTSIYMPGGGAYHYAVRAVNAAGGGAWSDGFSVAYANKVVHHLAEWPGSGQQDGSLWPAWFAPEAEQARVYPPPGSFIAAMAAPMYFDPTVVLRVDFSPDAIQGTFEGTLQAWLHIVWGGGGGVGKAPPVLIDVETGDPYISLGGPLILRLD